MAGVLVRITCFGKDASVFRAPAAVTCRKCHGSLLGHQDVLEIGSQGPPSLHVLAFMRPAPSLTSAWQVVCVT